MHTIDHVFCLCPGRSNAHGDQLANLANLFSDQNRLRGGLETGQRSIGANGLNAGHIGMAKHPRPDVVGNIKFYNPGMRHRAPEKCNFALID